MNNERLAARICGLLPQDRFWEAHCDSLTDDEVVTDWCVTGALMERCHIELAGRRLLNWTMGFVALLDNSEGIHQSLPRAISEHCVSVLSAVRAEQDSVADKQEE